MTTKEMIAVMQAFEEGKEIEYAAKWGSLAGKWYTIGCPAWDWITCIYRVKPEPKELYTVAYAYNGGEERHSTLRLTKEEAEVQAQTFVAAGFAVARVIKLREVLDES